MEIEKIMGDTKIKSEEELNWAIDNFDAICATIVSIAEVVVYIKGLVDGINTARGE